MEILGGQERVAANERADETLGKEERPVVGKLLNQARNAVTATIDRRLKNSDRKRKASSRIDISLPGWLPPSAYSGYLGLAGD